MLTKYSLGNVKFEAPDSWTVSDTDGTIEIVQEQASGAMHLSFLKRSLTDPPNDADARLLVENFASNNGLVPDGVVATSVCTFEARAIGRFHPHTPTAETPLHWLLASVVWQDRAIRVSYCTDVLSEESSKLAMGIIDSIVRE